jgi:hypothetical protein
LADQIVLPQHNDASQSQKGSRFRMHRWITALQQTLLDGEVFVEASLRWVSLVRRIVVLEPEAGLERVHASATAVAGRRAERPQ